MQIHRFCIEDEQEVLLKNLKLFCIEEEGGGEEEGEQEDLLKETY